MKKRMIISLFLISAMIFSSCAVIPQSQKDNTAVPDTKPVFDMGAINGSDNGAVIASPISEKTFRSRGVPDDKDEIEYHKSVGIPYNSNESMNAGYDLNSYDGAYLGIIDMAYRVKLDIELMRELGYDYPEYNGIYNAAVEFLKDHEPSQLLSRRWKYMGEFLNMYYLWQPVYFIRCAIIADEDRFLLDDKLVDLYACLMGLRMSQHISVTDDLYVFPALTGRIVPTSPAVTEKYFDSESSCHIIKTECGENERIIYRTEKLVLSCTDLLSGYSDNGTIELPADYSGYVSIAAVNEYGIISDTVFIDLNINGAE